MRSTDSKNIFSRLCDVASVQPGYLSRSGVAASPDGSHALLQAKDIVPDREIDVHTADRFDPERRPDLYAVRKDDILVLARGQTHWAYHISQHLRDVLASSSFYIVRADTRRVRPAYVAWWLNQPEAQAQIEVESRGTNIAYLSRRSLEQLALTVPPVHIQTRIESVITLQRRLNRLHAMINHKHEQLVTAACRRAVMGRQEST